MARRRSENQRGPARGAEERIPVVREELRVGKREVDRAEVRIRKATRERREQVDLPLLREETQIERVPINRPVAGPIPAREEDGTVVISLVEEVIEVHKSWVLREEIRVRKRVVQTRQPRTVTLRGEEVEIERVEPGQRGEPGRGGQGIDVQARDRTTWQPPGRGRRGKGG